MSTGVQLENSPGQNAIGHHPVGTSGQAARKIAVSCVTVLLFSVANLMNVSLNSPAWSGLSSAARFCLVLLSLMVGCIVWPGVRWLYQYRPTMADNEAAVRRNKRFVVLALVVVSTAIILQWTPWPFIWRFHGDRQWATDWAAKGQYATGMVQEAPSGFVSTFATDAGPVLCTNITGPRYAGVLYRPAGPPVRAIAVHMWRPPDSAPTTRMMTITYCRPLPPDWYAVTWTMGPEIVSPAND